jgi:hypothetical protein
MCVKGQLGYMPWSVPSGLSRRIHYLTAFHLLVEEVEIDQLVDFA